MKKIESKKRGLAPRALVADDARRAALLSLDRPASPAAAFVRAAFAEAAVEEPVQAPVAVAEAEAPAPAGPAHPERILTRVRIADVDLGNRRFQYRVSRTLAKLKESILEQGQQVPVILRGQVPYEIVSGFGRCDALAALAGEGRGDGFVWADVRADLSDREAHEISVLENEQRQDLSELDRISKAKKLKAEGYLVADIGTVLKKQTRMVQYYLSLAEAPARINAALAAGSLRATHALVLTKFARNALGELTPAEVEARLDDLIARCVANASVSELKAEIAGNKAPQVPALTPRGSGFEVKGFHFSPEATAEARRALLALLDDARARIAATL